MSKVTAPSMCHYLQYPQWHLCPFHFYQITCPPSFVKWSRTPRESLPSFLFYLISCLLISTNLSPCFPLQYSLHVENHPSSPSIISLTYSHILPSIHHQHRPDQSSCSLHPSSLDSLALGRDFSPPPSDEQLSLGSLITTSKPFSGLAALPATDVSLCPSLHGTRPGPVSWALYWPSQLF